MNSNEIGELGLLLVKEELVRLGIFSVELPKWFDFDLYTTNDLKLEVKTARKSTSKVQKQDRYEYEQSAWAFNNSFENASNVKKARKARTCDYYVLVCLNENSEVERFYIVPKDSINHDSKMIVIHENKTSRKSRSKYAPYLNNWSQILHPMP